MASRQNTGYAVDFEPTDAEIDTMLPVVNTFVNVIRKNPDLIRDGGLPTEVIARLQKMAVDMIEFGIDEALAANAYGYPPHVIDV